MQRMGQAITKMAHALFQIIETDTVSQSQDDGHESGKEI